MMAQHLFSIPDLDLPALPRLQPTATLILVCGLPGSGKTTLARRLAADLRAPLISKESLQALLDDFAPGAVPVTAYHLLMALAAQQLALGLRVILDAVFPTPLFREEAREIAIRHDAHLRIIHCTCSDEAAWQARIDADDPSGHRRDEFERLRSIYKPWQAEEAHIADSAGPLEANLAAAVAYVTG
jgi:hypothetical protein